MAIRNVNGRSVYVLEPSSPTASATTSGRSWATLYSDLRWKVWEEVQKAEMDRIKLQIQTTGARQDYIDSQRKFIQQQILDLAEARARGFRDQRDFGADQALRAAEGLQENAKVRSGGTKAGTKVTIKKQVPIREEFGLMTGGKIDLEETRTTEPSAVGLSEESKESLAKSDEVLKSIADKYLKGEATEAELDAAATNARKAREASIDEQIANLESQLAGLEASRPELGDLASGLGLEAQRRAFAQGVGVIGQGGGAFGLAPRSRRTQPIVFEDTATRRLEEALANREMALSELESKKAQLESEISSFDKLSPSGDLSSGLGFEIEKLNREIDLLSGPGLVQRLTEARPEFIPEGGRFTPREAGDLLLRDRLSSPNLSEFEGRSREPKEPREPRERPPREPRERPPRFPAPSPSPFGPPGTTNRPPSADELELMGAPPSLPPAPIRSPITRSPLDLQFLGAEPGESLEITPATPLMPRPSAPPPSVPRSNVELGTMDTGGLPPLVRPRTAPTVVPPTAVPPPPEERMLKLSLGEERIIPTDADPEKLFKYAGPLIGGPSGQYDPSVTDAEKKSIADEFNKLDPDNYPWQDFKGMEDWYKSTLESIRSNATPPQSKKSTKQRKDLYKIDIVTEGTKLASQPKKLERLAKTAAPTENRPQHIVLVDKLWETNKGKMNAFKMTYDEVSRIFSSDPTKRREAHQYLVAKDILESNKSEPLA